MGIIAVSRVGFPTHTTMYLYFFSKTMQPFGRDNIFFPLVAPRLGKISKS